MWTRRGRRSAARSSGCAQKVSTPERPGGVLVLTDMFGGTPANLGVTFLETDKVEVITGRQPARC